MMRESVAVSCNMMQLPSNRLAHAGQKAVSSSTQDVWHALMFRFLKQLSAF